jgi:adenine-specific DNA-methyltransferase
MAKSNTRLELTWIGKENRPKLEPRILIEDPEKSYHAAHRVSDNDIFDNRLIFGDNLLALKALEQEFTGKIKCIYIDPPYNTGSAFKQYEDGIEHSLWLSLMRDRLELLQKLLCDEGSLWVNLDDNEAHYFKVLADEVFGRSNFVTNIVWEKADSPRMDARFFSSRHDHLFVYARDINRLRVNQLTGDQSRLPAHYDKTDEKGKPYYLKPLRAMGGDDAREDRPSMFFEMTAPDGSKILPIRKDGSEGRWRWGPDRVVKDSYLLEWVKGRSGWSPYYRVYPAEELSRPPETIWPHTEVGSNRTSKAEIKAIFDGTKAFDTPKPEALLRRIIDIASNPADFVFDSFAGSGTTGAVAHKMGRRWIMVELGEQCDSLIIPRMRKVIDGDDQGGISRAVNWNGGGGFRYYKLGPTLIVEDEWGNPVINPQFNPAMLAEAMCKLEGFTFDPDPEIYWQQGKSTETDFIYITTQFMSKQMLTKLSDEVGPTRSLLICCSAFRCDVSQFENLTVKKIPKAVLKKCEWGHDDYSLEVANLPDAPSQTPEQQQHGPERQTRRFGKDKHADPTLFDMGTTGPKGAK